jgi:transcriptional regulator with XRE-family HTH domain
MEFWIRTKSLLRNRKITQENFCKECDISLATFVSWMHNNRAPDVYSAYKIAHALGTSVEYLVTGEDMSESARKLETIKLKLQELQECL